VSSYCINKAIGAIDQHHYEEALQKSASAKWKTLKSEPNIFIKMRKTQDYLMQKGFEPGLVSNVLRKLRGESE
jgi:regulatory protein